LTDIAEIEDHYDEKTLVICSNDYYALKVYFKGTNAKITGFDNIKTNGVLAILEFAVNENAMFDSFASVSLSYKVGDIINANFDDINIAIVSGGINITNFVYGDLNSDGLVNKKDSLLMKMYLADNLTTIDVQAADIYVDASINKKDSLLLKQYLAGLDVELGE